MTSTSVRDFGALPSALLALALVLLGSGCAEDEGTGPFRIRPQRPIAELREEARLATPPFESGDFKASDLVDLMATEPRLFFDIRYAGSDNFLGEPVYEEARAFLQREAATALSRVLDDLEADGFSLLVHDAYRPWPITKVFWEATPDSMKDFVADPSKGSRHNRGCAIDLTLCDRSRGLPVEMPSGYDEFTERAGPDYAGGSERARSHRDLLRRRMEARGFKVYEFEWWHFDFQGWELYPILSLSFSEIDAITAERSRR